MPGEDSEGRRFFTKRRPAPRGAGTGRGRGLMKGLEEIQALCLFNPRDALAS